MKTCEVKIFVEIGSSFAENKDVARKIRTEKIWPEIKQNGTVILDFERVDSTTQSFIHALISDLIRSKGPDVLDQLVFRNCNKIVKAVIEIVVEYMQEPPKGGTLADKK